MILSGINEYNQYGIVQQVSKCVLDVLENENTHVATHFSSNYPPALLFGLSAPCNCSNIIMHFSEFRTRQLVMSNTKTALP